MHFTRKTKNIILSIATLFALSTAQADTSNIAYQGVAFNNGSTVSSGTIALRFTLLQSNGTTVVYQETITGVTTTSQGFFSHQIGSGTRTAGAANYAAISWADGYKLKVEVDYANGTSYTDLGIQEFASSVYALKAKTADTATALTANPTDCAAGKFATTIAANGDLICATPAYTTDTNTVYTHPTTAGNKHIPSGGSSGKFLKYSASGTAVWATPSYIADTNTVYTHPTTAGNKHIPSGGSAGKFLKYSASGTAVWATPSYTTDTDTNTNTQNTINNTLTSTSTTESLSAAQGKVLKDTLGSPTKYSNPYAIVKRGTNGDFSAGVITAQFNGTANYATSAGTCTTAPSYLPLSGGIVSGFIRLTGYDTLDTGGAFTLVSYNQEDTVSQLPWTGNFIQDTARDTSFRSSLVATYSIVSSAFVALSDKRIKKNIKPIENALDIINKLNPVGYTKIDTVKYGNKQEYGFIAQEVKKVLPSAVHIMNGFIPVLKKIEDTTLVDGIKYKIQVTKDNKSIEEEYLAGSKLPEGKIFIISKEVNDFHTIEYDVLYTHAIKAIQEQQKQIETLKDELTQIKNALKSNGINIK